MTTQDKLKRLKEIRSKLITGEYVEESIPDITERVKFKTNPKSDFSKLRRPYTEEACNIIKDLKENTTETEKLNLILELLLNQF
jgi:hypothetical protein